ncbi:MAG TPA: M23 family metallopeptidase [Turneriella sp.]|nr:M23 family metallopeptidase [Turneriella sp.]
MNFNESALSYTLIDKNRRMMKMRISFVVVFFSCFVFCAGKSTRTPQGTERGLARAQANVSTFPEGADKSLPQVKKYTHEDITFLAWSKDFGRGHAVLFEIESTASLSNLSLFVDGKALPLIQGDGCLFALFANSPESTLKINKVDIHRGGKKLVAFDVPVVAYKYPVAKHKLNVTLTSNTTKPMSEETKQFIAQSWQKKKKAFVSASENYFSSVLRYPRDAHKITSPFHIKRVYERFKMVKGKRKSLKGRVSYHGGTDLKGLTGAPIFAVADGVVNLAEHLYYEGNITLIDHGYGVMTGYMHQSVILVKQGERVKAGQLIGKTGATGNVTGPHLHIFLLIHGVKTEALSLLALPLRPK